MIEYSHGPKKFEVYDLLRYFHNAKKPDGTLFPILGEDALALTASLSYLLEDTNFCIKAYSGTGKTVLMEAISALLPKDWIHTIEHLSETAVWYDFENINKARFVAIFGENERLTGTINVKDQETGNEKTVQKEELYNYVIEELMKPTQGCQDCAEESCDTCEE